MRRHAFAAALLLWPSLAFSQPDPAPIIDMHLHAYEAWEPELIDSVWIPLQFAMPKTDEELMRQSLAEMQRLNIMLAVTSGTASQVAQWRKADPRRVLPAIQFNRIPADPTALLDSLRALHAAGELMVMGELGIQYSGLSPSDPVFEPFLALAEELDIPVAIHMGPGPRGRALMPPHTFRSRLSSPLNLEDALVRHPNLRVYVMHAGWPFADDMVAMLHAFPNLYVDVGVINWYIPRAEFHSYLKRLVDAGYGDRIMFGSDQMNWPGAIEAAIEGIESAEFLTLKQKRDIFFNNAARFLRLFEGTDSRQ